MSRVWVSGACGKGLNLSPCTGPLPPQGGFSATSAGPLAHQALLIFSLFPPLPDPHHIGGVHILHCSPPTEEAKEGSGRAGVKFISLSISGVRQWPSLP